MLLLSSHSSTPRTKCARCADAFTLQERGLPQAVKKLTKKVSIENKLSNSEFKIEFVSLSYVQYEHFSNNLK